MRTFLLLCLAVLFAPVVARAQENGPLDEINASGTAYHAFVRSGEVTIQVLFVGDISAPGVYEVGADTDLAQLYALAGGAAVDREASGRKIRTTVHLYREQGGTRQQIYESDLDRMLLEPASYPALQTGDMVVMEARPSGHFDWRSWLQTVSSVATLAYVVVRILATV